MSSSTVRISTTTSVTGMSGIHTQGLHTWLGRLSLGISHTMSSSIQPLRLFQTRHTLFLITRMFKHMHLQTVRCLPAVAPFILL